MKTSLTKSLEIKVSGWVLASGEDVLGFMEEKYDESPFIQRVYENIKWGEIDADAIKIVKKMVLKELGY